MRRTLIVIGIVAIICATLGLLYNFSGRWTIFSGERPAFDKDQPYFWPAYCIMTVICIVCYLSLLVVGIQFIRGKVGWVTPFISLLVFEVLYFFSVAFLWTMPGIGGSVAGASGVANGGLMFQFIILFPLWGGIIAYRARRRFEQSI
jgi:hypothetical protein